MEMRWEFKRLNKEKIMRYFRTNKQIVVLLTVCHFLLISGVGGVYAFDLSLEGKKLYEEKTGKNWQDATIYEQETFLQYFRTRKLNSTRNVNSQRQAKDVNEETQEVSQEVLKRTLKIRGEFKEKTGKEWGQANEREQEIFLKHFRIIELKEKQKKVTKKYAPDPNVTLEIRRNFERGRNKKWEEATEEEQNKFFKDYEKAKKIELQKESRRILQVKRSGQISERNKKNAKRSKKRAKMREERERMLEHRAKEKKRQDIRRWIVQTKRNFDRKRQQMQRKRKKR